MFRRTHTELPDSVAQNDGNRSPFGLSPSALLRTGVAALTLFASRRVEARRWGLEPPLGSGPRPRRPSTPVLRPRSGQALRAYAQGERLERLRAGDFQRANTFERRCGKKQRGIAAVEFAIAVPILLLLMLATAELGRVIYQYNTLTKAVRAGARYLSSEALRGTTGVRYDQGSQEWEDIKEKTKNIVLCGKPEPCTADEKVLRQLMIGDIKVCEDLDPDPCDNIHVVVRVEYPYDRDPLFGGIPTFGFGDGNIVVAPNMTPSATMRAL